MQQFNFPTTLLYGEGSLEEGLERIKELKYKKILLVTDKTLTKIGLAKRVEDHIKELEMHVHTFDDVSPNPVEDDCIQGAKVFKENNCDAIIALGGGSPMDAAKGIMVLSTHEGPLSKYDDAMGGDRFITKKLPDLFAIPTTAGTGSEVGRSGVIIVNDTKNKTIIFHPTMLPKIAILEPTLTTKLPAAITAATGLDAFTHALEAYLAPTFHPMADGIALEAIKLVLENLMTAFKDPENIKARERMLLAASMGATAFQKGLGMIHSIAHPLSSECGLHHGLANALVLPKCIELIENSSLSQAQKERLETIQNIFHKYELKHSTLAKSCESYIESFNIQFGLKNHGVKESQIDLLAQKAFLDVCHRTNMINVTEENFKDVISKAMS